MGGFVGGALTAAGQFAQSEMQSKAAAYQAQISQLNAQNAAQQTAYNEQARETGVAELGMRNRAMVGKKVASLGAAGVDTRTGSAAQTVAGMRMTGMLNEQMLASRYAQKSQQSEWRQFGDLAQASEQQWAAQNLPILGGIEAGGTLLSAGAKYGFPFMPTG